MQTLSNLIQHGDSSPDLCTAIISNQQLVTRLVETLSDPEFNHKQASLYLLSNMLAAADMVNLLQELCAQLFGILPAKILEMIDGANMPTKKEALVCVYYMAEAGLKLNQMPEVKEGFYKSYSTHFVNVLKSYF